MPENDVPTVRDLLENLPDITYRTRLTYASALRSAGLLDLPAADVSLSVADKALSGLRSPGTRRKTAIVIRSVLGVRVHVPAPMHAARDLPSELDVRFALSLTKHETRLLLMAYAGLRCAETAAVTSSQMTGPGRMLVDRQVIERWNTASGEREVVPPKSNRSRQVYVPVWLAERVQELSIECTPAVLASACRQVTRRSGVRITPHLLRHWYATESIRRGMSPRALQRQLGHANITTTMETYVHPTEDDVRRIWG